jgi:integrase
MCRRRTVTELRNARWEQFDLERAQWRIPARCMKARVQHLVPLSRQALQLLRRLHSLNSDSEYLFPLIRDYSRPLHVSALNCALQSMGFDRKEVTPHGFRATACTLLNEMGWRSEAIERQMAHGVSDRSVVTTTTRSICGATHHDAGLS